MNTTTISTRLTKAQVLKDLRRLFDYPTKLSLTIISPDGSRSVVTRYAMDLEGVVHECGQSTRFILEDLR